MDRRQDLAALTRHERSRRGELVFTQDSAGDGLAVDVVHDDVRSPDAGVVPSGSAVAVRDDIGHGYADRGRTTQQVGLVRETPDSGGGRVLTQDEGAAVGTERPGLAAGAARQPA